MVINSPVTIAVGYVRLSVEDRANKGNSIENQKRIISSYIGEHSDLQLSEIYVDDGASGTTYARPAFTQMLEDARRGRFGCLIVKDVSRMGRNLIDTGYYVERVLPTLGIRFISINDEYDSSKSNDEIGFVFKSLVNEAYSLDIGRKVKDVIQGHMAKGQYIGTRPPFGYLISKDGRRALVIDEPAAAVVKQIYQWAADGKSVAEIVRLLNRAGTATPSRYWSSRGVLENVELLGDENWQTRTVQKILSNEIYTGTLVQGRTVVINKKRRKVPPEEWIRVDNTHPAIISREQFLAVQSLRVNARNDSSKKTGLPYSPNLFKGKIFCAHCGNRLDRKKSHQNYLYRCTAKYISPGSCEGNSIREEAVVKAVANALLEYAEAINSSPREIWDFKEVDFEMAKMQVEASYEEDVLRSLYENFVAGKLTDQEFQELKIKHQQKVACQNERWAQLMLRRANQRLAEAEWQDLSSVLDMFSETMELKQELVDTFVKRIEVFTSGQIFIDLNIDNLTS